MRSFKMLLLATSLLSGAAQAASDKVLFGPVPDWVKPLPVPAAPAKPDEAPARLLLADQQTHLERDEQTNYIEAAIKIQTPQGLSAGNLSFPWNPDTQSFTVHKLVIHRGDKDIDVLASGQTFTVARREQNLDSATLDGVLTANIQPEGLQVGDVLDFALSIATHDPVLKGHIEQAGAAWNALPISHAHFRAEWPSGLHMSLRESGLPAVKPVKAHGMTSVELDLKNIEPIVPPKYAPARYRVGRVFELSDFQNWSDLAALMAPLYVEASKIPAQGPLRNELEKIRAASDDPVQRTQAVLSLVQDRVRYVALLMGAGGLTPADAATTWSRRFGDCKAKTALLLGLLHELGVKAEPVLANAISGDGIDERLPMVGLFNHVLVRATIDGKTYWLDGTRTGDTDLARLRTPYFSWGLPVLAKGAKLVRMVPAPLDKPQAETLIHIDARQGLSLPAPIKAETILRGDSAVGIKLQLASVTADIRNRFLKEYWKGQFSFVDVTKTGDSFDPATGEEHLTMEGTAHMDWSDGTYATDNTDLGFKADFSREPGPDQDAPFKVAYPGYERTVETIQLPPGFPNLTGDAAPGNDQTIAGIEYHRHAQLENGVFTVEATSRAIAPEFPAKDASAAQKALRDLAESSVYLKKPPHYQLTDAELKIALADKPTSSAGFQKLGIQLLNRARYTEAREYLDHALELDPKNVVALANRGVTRIWQNDLDGAAKDLDAAAAINPQFVVIWHGRGLIAERKGAEKEALAAYSKALTIDPGDLFAIVRHAHLAHELGDDTIALRDAGKALKLNPAQLELYLLRANIFRNTGDRDSALAEVNAATAANPKSNYAFVVAARFYAAYELMDKAKAAIDRALAIKPEGFIYTNRAAMRPATDIAGRMADYDAALALEPDMPEALSGKSKLLLKQGKATEAIKLYTAALAKEPKMLPLLLGRGIAYAKAGDMAHAETDFAAARKTATSGMALNNLCYGKATADVALESALAECDAALAKSPNAANIMDSRAFVLLRMGRIDDAMAEYDRALAKRPNSADSLFGRAVAWSRKGDQAKAQADLAAALKSDPDIQKTFAAYGVTLDVPTKASEPEAELAPAP